MTREPERIPAVIVRAVIELGMDAAAFRTLDGDSTRHRLHESASLAEDPDDASAMSAAMTDLVLERGETVVARRRPAEGESPMPGADAGFEDAVAGPIWVEGWIAGVLVGAARVRLSTRQIQAFGLLASHAGLTLDNAQRLEDERQTAGRLEQGDRLKTEFLTTISHELRTPLTVLIGNGITLEQTWSELDDESRLELLSSMNANVRLLDEMLANLLDYSRLEAGELWVSFEPFNVSDLVTSVCARGAEALNERRIETNIQHDLLASGDVVLIRRVVSALLANAVTHTPPGTTVVVSCHRRGPDIEVEVTDDGAGIADEDLPFLGERFFRGGRANTRPKGLGLGLALAGGILDLHDSVLRIRNDPAGGASFSFSLPAVSDPSRSPVGETDVPSRAHPSHDRRT